MHTKPTRRSHLAIAAAAAVAISTAIPAARAAAAEPYRSPEYDVLFPQGRQPEAAPGTALAPEIAPPLETPIDPRTYRMVPGDLLQLDVGGETDRAWRLAVNADGTLTLPGSPSVPAAGMTLDSLVARVRAQLLPRFPRNPIELHLLQPGAIRVPVTGLVATPGILALHTYDRVSAAVSTAGGPLPGASLRRIALTLPDGSRREVDLVRFALSGDMDQNPFLAPGMSIQVPSAQQYVRVTGAVRGIPGTTDRTLAPNVGSRIPEMPNILLEWRRGDTARLALNRAGGLSEEASGTLLILRDGARREVQAADADTVALRPGDLLEAAVRERWVYVNGAVRYPGPYPHLPSLTASDYVRIAGGPTEIGKGNGWRLKLPGSDETQHVGNESYVPPGSTILVPERWTYRTSMLLAPLSGITALLISLVALRKA